MIEIVTLILAISLAAPLALKIDSRYIAIVTSVALASASVYYNMPIGVLVSLLALAMALDKSMGVFGLALSFSTAATVLAIYVYYAPAPVTYALVALALVTASVYGMLAMGKTRENVESAVKYVVFSGIGKVLIVVGYFSTLAGVAEGIYITLLGFMIELGIVPFHAWVVDTYALGAPRGVAALAAFSKMTTLFLLLAIVRTVPPSAQVGFVAVVISLASMLVANVAGLTAKTLGRVMAYSSIAHMSYALAAVAVVWWLGDKSTSLFGHTWRVLDLAALVIVLEALTTGVAKAGIFSYLTTNTSDASPPRRSVLNVLNVFSLLGLPPLLGFWPKLFLIYLLLAYLPAPIAIFIIAWVVVNSALATPYYLRTLRIVAEAPAPNADNITSTYTALTSTLIGLLIPLAFIYLIGTL